MAKLTLSCALGNNPRTRPILDGAVKPQDIELQCKSMHPSEMFFRQLKYKEFDVSEMSMASMSIATDKGQRDWIMIPVFTTRIFFHTGVIVRNDRGIEKPQDLNGKAVGVPEFQQTACIWTREVLRSEFGVDMTSLKWFMERNPDQSHGGSTGFQPPPGIDLTYTPKDTNNGQMLLDGKLDALLHWIFEQNLIDRSSVDVRQSPDVRFLFDADAEARRYYEKTKIFPINHGLVVRRSIYEEHPWVIKSIYDAFVAAKGPSDDLKGYPAPYGIEPCRKVLETITGALVADGLTSRRVGLDELFAPEAFTL